MQHHIHIHNPFQLTSEEETYMNMKAINSHGFFYYENDREGRIFRVYKISKSMYEKEMEGYDEHDEFHNAFEITLLGKKLYMRRFLVYDNKK
jgi:hypothetical protein